MDIRRRVQIGGLKKTSSGGGSTTEGSYTVNLNGQWEATTAVPNPDSTLYDGVYRSSSNYNVDSGVATMYITIKDCSSFKMYIRSYAESSWDYVMVSQLDKTINGNTSYSNTTMVKAHTRGKQQSGTALSNYTLVEFTGISSGEHTITVVYRKDDSGHSGDDRGYVLIEKIQVINIDNYLTIEARENGLTASLSTNACEYCVDGDGNWKTLAANTATESINAGHTLSFRGNLTPASSKGIGTFTINKKCNLTGNCMSMLFGDDAANNYSLSSKNYAFYQLFYNCTNIVNVSSDFLPATTLAGDCYSKMFQGCTNLAISPKLPATTLADYCYQYMFSGCTGIVNAPDLPATTLATWCYSNMFKGCTSLTTTSKLPATTLKNACYDGMFYGCTNLTQSPDLPATTLVTWCYRNMFNSCSKLNYIKMLATDISENNYCLKGWVYNVASSGTFVKNPDMNSLPTGTSGIPEGWTVVNDGESVIDINNYLTIEALEDGLTASLSTNACEYCIDGDGKWKSLTAGTATESIIAGQTLSFRGELIPNGSNGIGTFTISQICNLKGNCMSMLFGDNAANNYSLSGKNYAFCDLFYYCYNIVNVSSNFLPATTLSNYCYQSMFLHCTGLTTAPELPATTLADSCYSSMFFNCNSLKSAPELPATTLANYCYDDMFYSCSSLTAAPELPATTLKNYCYRNMFNHCRSLRTAPVLPATALANNCYDTMFTGCKKLTYIKMLATDISASNCLSSWVSGVAPAGTFVKNPAMTTLPTGTSGIPSGWTVENDGEESGVSNEITFYIDDEVSVTPMKALRNMTWGQFVDDSEYANQNSMFTDFTLVYYDVLKFNGVQFYHEERNGDVSLYHDTSHYNYVKNTDIVEDGKTYYIL